MVEDLQYSSVRILSKILPFSDQNLRNQRYLRISFSAFHSSIKKSKEFIKEENQWRKY
jgi:hypothetical protein